MAPTSRRRTPATFLHVALLCFAIAAGALPARAETSALAAGDLPPIFMRGNGATPAVLSLNTAAPSSTTPKFKDSASVAIGGGNPWKEIGTWTAPAAPFTGAVSALNPLHLFPGLKTSDDEGTRFDLRAEVFRNGSPVTAGQTLCAAGVTRNPDTAREILVSFDVFPEVTFAAADVMSVKVLTRIGTNGTGGPCGSHGSAAGLRLYFDSFLRASRFEPASVEGLDWSTAVGGSSSRTSLARAAGPAVPSVAWQGGSPGSFFSPSVTEGNLVVYSALSTGVVEAHDIGTGALLWTAEIPAEFPSNVRVDAIRDGQVYATPANGSVADFLYALKAFDGSILWRSQEPIDESALESLSFASNGDLIVGGFLSVSRINHVNGQTVWKADRFCAGNGSCMAPVFGSHVYVLDFNAGTQSNFVSVFDVTSGEKLYSSADLGVPSSQSGIFIGPDATVYCPMDGGDLSPTFAALRDTGSALTEKWRLPMAWTPFASHGLGPDGSVYMYSADHRVLRLEPATGRIRNRSMPIPFGDFFPRIAIDSAGRVFLADLQNAVFSFNSDLTLRWTENFPGASPAGLAIARDGTLIVTSFEGLRAYRTP